MKRVEIIGIFTQTSMSLYTNDKAKSFQVLVSAAEARRFESYCVEVSATLNKSNLL